MAKRMVVKMFPESNEFVVTGFGLLHEICSSSLENKAMLFTEDGWYHFERIYRKHPLKSLFLLKDIFETDKSLLYVDLTIFFRIFKLYRSFLVRILHKGITKIPTNEGV